MWFCMLWGHVFLDHIKAYSHVLENKLIDCKLKDKISKYSNIVKEMYMVKYFEVIPFLF